MADQYSVKLDIQFETIKALKDALALANKELEKAKVNTIEWANAFEKVGQLKGQMTQVNQVIRQTGTTMQGTTQASSNAAMALLNLNYVIRDSPYFFNNFALGLLAVGNNLNPLIDSFMRAKVAAKEAGSTITKDLKMALVGGAGISIAFSVVVTAIQSYVFATSRAKDKTRSLTDEVKSLWSETYKTTKQWDEFILSLDKMSKSDVDESIKGLDKELDDVNITFMEVLSAGGNWVKTLDNIIDRTVKLIKLRDVAKSKKEKEGIIGGGIIEEQEALVESLTILEKSAKTYPEMLGWQKLRKEAQEKLNELMGEETKELEKQHRLWTSLASDVVLRKVNPAFGITLDIVKQINDWMEKTSKVKIDTGFTGQLWNLPQRLGAKTGWERMVEKYNEGKKAKDSMKEFNMALETGKIFAQELGDALGEMMTRGVIAIDRLVQSILVAIGKMLIMRAIVSALFPLSTVAGGAPIPYVVPSYYGGGSLPKGSNPTFIFENKIDSQEIVYKGMRRDLSYVR